MDTCSLFFQTSMWRVYTIDAEALCAFLARAESAARAPDFIWFCRSFLDRRRTSPLSPPSEFEILDCGCVPRFFVLRFLSGQVKAQEATPEHLL